MPAFSLLLLSFTLSTKTIVIERSVTILLSTASVAFNFHLLSVFTHSSTLAFTLSPTDGCFQAYPYTAFTNKPLFTSFLTSGTLSINLGSSPLET